MASFDYRLNPFYAIKEGSSCGTLYTGDCGYSKGGLEDKILVPIPDLSRRPLKIEKNCLDCGDPVHGLYCRQCALIRKTLEDVFQDFQDTSKSSDDDTNFVNQDPFVVKQTPGPHETYQCQPTNEDYYHEQNSCYDYNSFGFDQFQPPQYTVNHPIFNAQNDFLNSQNKLMEQMTSICDMVGQYMQKKEEEKRIAKEQAAKDRYWKIPVCYDDNDDEESSIPLKDIISELPSCVAITPDSPKTNSLIMEDEHLDTIPETESDKLIKSSVQDLVQIPSESEDSSKGECDLPSYDLSLKNHDLTFSNSLFDINEDFTSSDESFSEEDVPNENFKIFSNPLFDLDEEIHVPTKSDTLLDEVCQGEIHLVESLLYDNSSPRPPEEFNSENSTKSFSPSPILIEDSDSLIEEIDIFLDGDDSIPPDSTIDVVEDILVDVPNIFPTHPALLIDFDFIPSLNDLGSDLDVSSPSGDSNKIYDPGICIEVESKRTLATLSPEKSSPSSSHQGLKALQLSSKSPMLIHGDNTPNLGVRHPHFYPP
ncbi:hypothetical protein Tco_0386112 [Tanacetum coccineum]